MIYKKFGNKYVLRIDKGEEIGKTLEDFALEHDIKFGILLSGIGATSHCVTAVINQETLMYEDKEHGEPMEVTSLVGNISRLEDKPVVHAHITLAKIDHSVIGGHFKSGIVGATCEIVINDTGGEFNRKKSTDSHLNTLSQ